MQKTHEIKDYEALRQFAEGFAAQIQGGVFIALNGPLGAGKTTFTALLVSILGGKVPVSSPTFVLCHEYPVGKGLTVEHWDLYRVKEVPEELLESPGKTVIRIVEWAEKFPAELGTPDWSLHIEFGSSENSRRILLTHEDGR